MRSLSKIELSRNQIETIIKNAFDTSIVSFSEVVNGYYNTIYKIELIDKNVYLKIAPSDDVDILRYEKEIMIKEVEVSTLLESVGVPTPVILYKDFRKTIIPNNYYIMSEIEGKTIHEYGDEIDKKSYYKQLMKYLAILHNHKAEYFGYHNQREYFDTYSETLFYMINDVIEDSIKKNHNLQPFMYDIIEKIHNYKPLLDTIKQPSVLHFDAWDANIMIDDQKIVGIIDTERSYNGPRIAEFAPLSFDIFDEEYSNLIEEYNKYATTPIRLDDTDKTLFLIHKVYLFLLMYVECAYRDIDGSFERQKQWTIEVLTELHTML